jgi:hypothetical protein
MDTGTSTLFLEFSFLTVLGILNQKEIAQLIHKHL